MGRYMPVKNPIRVPRMVLAVPKALWLLKKRHDKANQRGIS